MLAASCFILSSVERPAAEAALTKDSKAVPETKLTDQQDKLLGIMPLQE